MVVIERTVNNEYGEKAMSIHDKMGKALERDIASSEDYRGYLSPVRAPPASSLTLPSIADLLIPHLGCPLPPSLVPLFTTEGEKSY